MGFENLLEDSIAQLCAAGKGILAADESPGTLGKRLKNTPELSHLENVEEIRRQWREILVTSDTGPYFCGVIMHEETLLQSTEQGKLFVDCLREKKILAGIKVDQGLAPLGGTSADETSTKGLDTLEERCAKYRDQGARFAKWRAALKVTANLPSPKCVRENAEQLARYAKICQDQGLVPIVEPEILINTDYDMARSKIVSTHVLSEVVSCLKDHRVDLSKCLLKPQMVMPGTECPEPKATPSEVASATLEVFDACLPHDLAGVFFLSGGLTEEQATENLNEINRLACQRYPSPSDPFDCVPWKLSFSFGRALQASVLKLWAGRKENGDKCRDQSRALAEANFRACGGAYQGPHPSLLKDRESLVETFRGMSSMPDTAK